MRPTTTSEAANRPVFILELRAEPNVDPVRALLGAAQSRARVHRSPNVRRITTDAKPAGDDAGMMETKTEVATPYKWESSMRKDPARAAEQQIKKQLRRTIGASREMTRSMAEHLLPPEYVSNLEQALANNADVSLTVTLYPMPSVSLLCNGQIVCTLASTTPQRGKLH